MTVCPGGDGSLPPPDADVPCCMASAHGRACSCWTAVLRPEPHDEPQEGPSAVRSGMCGDCAYRPGSPERPTREDDPPSTLRERPFYCHDGMPRAVGYEHPDLPGVTLRADAFDSLSGDYQPLMKPGRAFQADGSPALLCAGWAAFTRSRR